MEKTKKKLFEQVLKQIVNHDIILLFRHLVPDPDALGSVWGLKAIINYHFPEKKVWVLGEDEMVNKTLFPQNDHLVHLPQKPFLAIICDTANAERIDGEFWRSANHIIKFDHHPTLDQSYAHLDVVFENYASTCELVAEFAHTMNLTIPADGAKYLYTGIITDTGRFLYPGVDEKTFTIAAKLIACGIDINAIYQNLYTKDIRLLKFLGAMIEKIEFFNQTIMVYIDASLLQKHNITPEEAKFLINTMAGYENFNIWVMGIEKEDHIKVSLRSKKSYHINKVAQYFKGGGHKNAAACKVLTRNDLDKIVQLCEKVTPHQED